MSEQALTLLKLVFLAMLYLFFLRVLWSVYTEIRRPVDGLPSAAPAPSPQTASAPPPAAPAVPPTTQGRPKRRRTRSASMTKKRGPTGAVIGQLVVVEPTDRAGISYALGKELTMGRAPGCGVPLDDTYVSQLHARVYMSEDRFLVEDLGSRNGTFHNGAKLSGSKVLAPGDRVQVGSTIMEFS